jgi:hypothetical protein
MTEIKTPDCPLCGALPLFTGCTPYFCANDECEVLYWDPSMTLAEIRSAEPKWFDFDNDATEQK